MFKFEYICILILIVIFIKLYHNRENFISNYRRPDLHTVVKGCTLTPVHSYGFFACTNEILTRIIEYFNFYKKLPCKVDSSNMFRKLCKFTDYKTKNNGEKLTRDITYDLFMRPREDIKIKYSKPVKFMNNEVISYWMITFDIYNQFNLNQITPFIEKYFTPSYKVQNLILNLEREYGINNYENLVAVYYRGTEKKADTKLGDFNEWIGYANEIQKSNPTIKFLIMSDEPKNVEKFKLHFPNTVECRVQIERTYEHCFEFLANSIILSKAKYFITGSSNVSTFIVFYRGMYNKYGTSNIIQHLDRKKTWMPAVARDYKNIWHIS